MWGAALLLLIFSSHSAAYPGADVPTSSSSSSCRRGDRRCFPLACPPGQGRSVPNEPCSLCPYGTYNPGGVYGPCLRCPPGSVTINLGSTECGCPPGTGTLTINEGPCRPCANGTYAPGGSRSPCTRCPGSAFMVTPPKATRVSQCTCKPGFGSTPNFPYSCQQCPIGTYANALGQIIGIPGVPPQGGKGVTRGLTGATILPCKPCCPGGVGTCSYTTLQPGSTSFNQCVLEPPPVPPVTGYCCGGVACATPVPEPPSNLPANARSADSIPEGPSQVQRERAQLLPPPNRVQPPGGRGDWPGGGNAMGGGGSSGGFSVNPQSRWWGNGGDDGDSDGGDARRPGALTVCSAQPRVAVADPTSGIAGNTPWLVLYWGDPTPGTSCPYKPGSLGVYGCTGSQLAPYLVLTAAHCVDPQMYDIAGCTDLRLVSITLCYGYTRPKSGSFVCPASKGVEAVGVSWYDHASATSPNDQAIVFASAAKPPPYYKYNYIENMPGVFTSQSNKFQALNYVGDGLAATKQCGCGVCDMPCGLAQTGPSSGPLTNDTHSVTAGNGAVNGQLEACGGSSGGCMTINGEACCMAVDSYEWIAATACTSACSSYWSTISAAKPLSDLWKTIRLALPQTLT